MKAPSLSDKIHIHPLFFLLALSAFLTGAIYEFIILFSIVAIHELGHFYTAQYYGWRVTKVEFWLFGGAVVSDEHNTRPFREQVQVIIAGPVQHIWIFAVLFSLQGMIGSHPLITTALYYNGLILLFNLLPIWPLDGGKLLFYSLNQLIPFRKSLLVSLVISLFTLFVVGSWLIFEGRWTLAGVLLASFLLLENILEWKRRSYTWIRFLMYCARRNEDTMKSKYIYVDKNALVRDVLKNIRSNRSHLYVLKQSPHFYIVNEQECLHAFLKRKEVNLRIKDIPKVAL